MTRHDELLAHKRDVHGLARDIPIIFSAPMVQALLEGRKTMTRRLAWRLNKRFRDDEEAEPLLPSPWQRVEPGDRLWVRENFNIRVHPEHATDGKGRAWYMADPETSTDTIRWRPSIHMPRWASRLTLVVTATKVERLQSISEADAIAEGVNSAIVMGVKKWFPGSDPNTVWDSAREAFCCLWQVLHGKDSWDANPEVVALTFTVHKQNIDQLEAA